MLSSFSICDWCFSVFNEQLNRIINRPKPHLTEGELEVITSLHFTLLFTPCDKASFCKIQKVIRVNAS